MHSALADHLACPSCRKAYDLRIDEAVADEIRSGLLICPGCGMMVPIIQGFALFTEIDIDPPVAVATQRWFGTAPDYAAYRNQKFRRDQLEIYAAFHPFNESVRAIDAVLPVLAAGLRPGDMILDPWARTGWNGFRLAQRFPEQRIVALVEGDRDVLGYRGVAHWLAHGRRPPNLDILFVHPGRPLPFADDTFAGVHSHDCLHRFPIEALASELLRVSAPGAPLILAHVHLSNSEPDPWFDRGCTIRHGQSYRRWLDRVCQDGTRAGRVFSEGDLFDVAPGDLPPDSPDTKHYNALILIADPQTAGLAALPAPDPTMRYLLNPLFRLHLGRRTARIERSHRDGMVGELLDRHPIYQRRLPDDAIELSGLQLAVVALALVGRSFNDIADHLAADAADLSALIDPLVGAELLLPVAVSADAVAMQRFHANQLPPASSRLADFIAALPENGARLLASDGAEVCGADITELVDRIASVLAQLGVGPAMSLGLALRPHPLSLLTLLAGLTLGGNVALAPLAGNADLVIVDEPGRHEKANAARIAMGWAGEPGSLTDRLESLGQIDRRHCRDGGRISIAVDTRIMELSADLLCEAALSLTNGAASVSGAGAVIDTIEGLLMCMMMIGRGDTVSVSGFQSAFDATARG